MASNTRSFQFATAVHGFNVYRENWGPVMNKVLNCFHKSGSDFDMCCIKVCKNGTIVGHLPREVSRPRKFMLDCRAIVKAQLNGFHYLKSPLFQGELEIPCFVTLTLLGTTQNHKSLRSFICIGS